MKSLNLIMGAKGKNEREENDFYATHPSAVVAFMEQLKQDKIDLSDYTMWECACGMGHISEVLKKYGYEVYSSDLIDRGYNGLNKIGNFLSEDFNPIQGKKCIITNPPYKNAEDFCRVAKDKCNEGDYVMFFLKIQFLESKARKKLFEEFKPKYVYINSERQQCSMNADFENFAAKTLAYIWIVWQKGYNGETILRWI